MNYGSIAALAAASRALRGYRDELADECLATATRVWDEEHQHAPDLLHHGNTTGGTLEEEKLRVAVELLNTTSDGHYAQRIDKLWPTIDQRFGESARITVRALPFMSQDFARQLEARAAVLRRRKLHAAGQRGEPRVERRRTYSLRNDHGVHAPAVS